MWGDDNSIDLFMAAQKGDTEEVRRLIPISDATIQSNRALRHAVSEGHAECVKLLLPVSRLTDEVAYENLVVGAIENNHTECVKILLAVENLSFDPSFAVTYFLMRAVSWEKIDLVRFLIPLALNKISTDERYTYTILQTSILNGNEDIFNELLVFSNPQLAWDDLQKRGRTHDECVLVVNHLERLQQHKNISAVVTHAGGFSPLRKI